MTFSEQSKRRDPEGDLHKAIWQHIQLRGQKNVIAYHPPNGGLRSKRGAAKLKAMGVVPGIPDLAFTLVDGRSAYIEIKAPGGRLSPEQRAFMDKCVSMGVPHAVVSSIDMALAVLTEWEIIK